MRNIVIVGASSAIAEAVAQCYAKAGDNLYLLARNVDKLERIKQDLLVRGAATVAVARFEANDTGAHEQCVSDIVEQLTHVDVWLIAYGSLPDQEQCQRDTQLMLQEVNTNGVSVVSLLTHVANKMELQGSGTIAAITSVAGDRGRQSNYVYGAAKGMVSIFMQGLAQRLYRAGVHVWDVKPGFVDTPMTASFDKGLLWAQPEKVAAVIYKRIEKRQHCGYVPSFWALIMFVIKRVPYVIFKKLSL